MGEWLQRIVQRKLRDELLNAEIFDALLEAKVLIERWRHHYNTVRPHSSLGYRPPAPEAIQTWLRRLRSFVCQPCLSSGKHSHRDLCHLLRQVSRLTYFTVLIRSRPHRSLLSRGWAMISTIVLVLA